MCLDKITGLLHPGLHDVPPPMVSRDCSLASKMQWGGPRIISENEIWGGSTPTKRVSRSTMTEESMSLEGDRDKVRADFVFSLCKEGPSISFSVVNAGVPQTDMGTVYVGLRPLGTGWYNTQAPEDTR